MWKEFPKTKLNLTLNICRNTYIFNYVVNTFRINISPPVETIVKHGQLQLLKHIYKNKSEQPKHIADRNLCGKYEK
jgi:hypothetical protein